MDLVCHGFDDVLTEEVHQRSDGRVLRELSLKKLEGLNVLPALLETLDRKEHHEEPLLWRARKVFITILEKLRDDAVSILVVLICLLRVVYIFLISAG